MAKTTRPGRPANRMIDVARRAGVSTASVSRAINSPQKVSATMRARIDSVLGELGYVPHGPARALAGRRSYAIGAVVPTLGVGIFAAGVEAMQQRLETHGHALLVASSRYDSELEARQVRTLLARGVDGIALVGHRHRPEVFDAIADAAIPYVCLYTYRSGAHPCVGIDQGAATRRVIDFLVDLGHRRFGVITNPTRDNDRISSRVDGVLEACRHHQLQPPSILEVPYTVADGRIALRTMIERVPDVTAIACTTDLHAFGALAEARARGIAIPGRLSITGFDDLDLAAEVEPPLTTICVPAREIGERAADLLVASVAGQAVPEHLELGTTLVVRSSTGPAPIL
jgi:LacI family transcriptional regulator